MKYILLTFLFCISVSSHATENSPTSKIMRLVSYSEYGGGDVFVKLESSAATCTDGYFISQSSPGFQNNFSMLLSAYHAKLPILIKANEGVRWSGSQNPVCQIYGVYYQ